MPIGYARSTDTRLLYRKAGLRQWRGFRNSELLAGHWPTPSSALSFPYSCCPHRLLKPS